MIRTSCPLASSDDVFHANVSRHFHARDGEESMSHRKTDKDKAHRPATPTSEGHTKAGRTERCAEQGSSGASNSPGDAGPSDRGLEELFAELESRWESERSADVVDAIAREHPEAEDALWEFFELLLDVEQPTAPSGAEQAIRNRVAQRVYDRLAADETRRHGENDVSRSDAAMIAGATAPTTGGRSGELHTERSNVIEGGLDEFQLSPAHATGGSSAAAAPSDCEGNQSSPKSGIGAHSTGDACDTQPLVGLLRQRTGERLGVIAQALGTPTSLLVLMSEYPSVVPPSIKCEVMSRVTRCYPVTVDEVSRSFEREFSYPKAASREGSYSRGAIDFEEMLRRAKLPPEESRFWLDLANAES